ncbi:hypothetical protein, partial [Acidipropionibacterium jensenii]|uniref:hypothetical protein n=1 Tax=Acidipropionibacterium jensenii TaxID=1749 RepID=UPI002647E95F
APVVTVGQVLRTLVMVVVGGDLARVQPPRGGRGRLQWVAGPCAGPALGISGLCSDASRPGVTSRDGGVSRR